MAADLLAAWLPAGLPLDAMAAAALLGLGSVVHCAGMCGPIAVIARGAWPWQLGRVLAYAGLGMLAGGAGAAVFAVVGPGVVWVSAALWLVALLVGTAFLAGFSLPAPAGGRMLGAALRGLAGREGLARGPRLLVLGLANGLLPCGLAYAALPLAASAGGPLQGWAVGAAFGLTTVPALALVGVSTRWLASVPLGARRVVAALVLVAGLGALGLRLAAEPDEDPLCHVPQAAAE